jgi:hypothetical protein
MANPNTPFGLRPVQYLNGSPWNGQARQYYIPSTDANAYAIGDPVKTLTGAADSNGVSAVTLATAGSGNAIRGVIVSAGGTVFAGPSLDTTSLETTVIPASKTKNYYVLVVDDPMVIFEIQEFSGSGSTNFTAADVGKNSNLKSGTNNGYISAWVLDDTAASATTAAYQLRLLGIAPRKDNAFGSYCDWRVVINNHEFKAAVAGV